MCIGYFKENADVCIPETPPLLSANVCNWIPPPPLKVADGLCGRPHSVPKNLGVGVNFRPCSEGYFLSGRP